MGDTGREHTPLALSKTQFLGNSDAKSDARNAPNTSQTLRCRKLSQNLSKLARQFPELIRLIERWPILPDNIKEAIKVLTTFLK
jgi:hypothetical protein